MFLLQPGLSDLQRQKIQQKLDLELIEKRGQHLAVYKKSSLDRPDEDERSSTSEMVMEDVSIDVSRSKIRDLKKEDSGRYDKIFENI